MRMTSYILDVGFVWDEDISLIPSKKYALFSLGTFNNYMDKSLLIFDDLPTSKWTSSIGIRVQNEKYITTYPPHLAHIVSERLLSLWLTFCTVNAQVSFFAFITDNVTFLRKKCLQTVIRLNMIKFFSLAGFFCNTFCNLFVVFVISSERCWVGITRFTMGV